MTVLFEHGWIEIRVLQRGTHLLGWGGCFRIREGSSYRDFEKVLNGNDYAFTVHTFNTNTDKNGTNSIADFQHATFEFADEAWGMIPLTRMTQEQALATSMQWINRPSKGFGGMELALYEHNKEFFALRKRMRNGENAIEETNEQPKEKDKPKKEEHAVDQEAAFKAAFDDTPAKTTPKRWDSRFNALLGAVPAALAAVGLHFWTKREPTGEEESETLMTKSLGTFDLQSEKNLRKVRRDNNITCPPEFDVGKLIVARDKFKILCRALVLKTRTVGGKKEVYVRYIDWSNTWNEWLPVDSDRIARKPKECSKFK